MHDRRSPRDIHGDRLSTYLDTNSNVQTAFLATGSLGAVYTIGLEHVLPRSLAKHLLRGHSS